MTCATVGCKRQDADWEATRADGEPFTSTGTRRIRVCGRCARLFSGAGHIRTRWRGKH